MASCTNNSLLSLSALLPWISAKIPTLTSKLGAESPSKPRWWISTKTCQFLSAPDHRGCTPKWSFEAFPFAFPTAWEGPWISWSISRPQQGVYLLEKPERYVLDLSLLLPQTLFALSWTGYRENLHWVGSWHHSFSSIPSESILAGFSPSSSSPFAILLHCVLNKCWPQIVFTITSSCPTTYIFQ